MDFINNIKIKLRIRHILRASGWLLLTFIILNGFLLSIKEEDYPPFLFMLIFGAMGIGFLYRAIVLLKETFRDEQHNDMLKAIEKIGDISEIGNEISKLQANSYVKFADVRYNERVVFLYIKQADCVVDVRVIVPQKIEKITVYKKHPFIDNVLIRYKDHNNYHNSVELTTRENYGGELKSDIIEKCNLVLKSKKKLIESLKPYFDAGVLIDTLYISNEFCIFNYGDMCYVGFPSADWPEYPIGMVIPPKYIEDNIDNPLLFFEQFKIQVDENFSHMCHFSEKNLDFYINNLERIKKTIPSHIDTKLNERIKNKLEYKKIIKR